MQRAAGELPDSSLTLDRLEIPFSLYQSCPCLSMLNTSNTQQHITNTLWISHIWTHCNLTLRGHVLISSSSQWDTQKALNLRFSLATWALSLHTSCCAYWLACVCVLLCAGAIDRVQPHSWGLMPWCFWSRMMKASYQNDRQGVQAALGRFCSCPGNSWVLPLNMVVSQCGYVSMMCVACKHQQQLHTCHWGHFLLQIQNTGLALQHLWAQLLLLDV